jgi:hypothetical protein
MSAMSTAPANRTAGPADDEAARVPSRPGIEGCLITPTSCPIARPASSEYRRAFVVLRS